MKRLRKALLLALVFTVTVVAPVLAYTYRASYTVTEANGTAYTMLPVTANVSNQWMADNSFMEADALDTRIETLAGSYKPHMVVDDRTLTAIPVPANSQTNLHFTTGNSDLTTLDIIVGYNGYLTVADDDTIELGANFTAAASVYADTDSGNNKRTIHKEGVFEIAGDNLTSGNLTGAMGTAGLIFPISFSDASGNYTNETEAYDDNLATGANIYHVQNTYNGMLQLTHTGLWCDRVYYYMDTNAQTTSVNISGYIDGAWTVIYTGAFTGSAWNTATINSTVFLSNIGFSFYCTDTGWVADQLREVRLGGVHITEVTATGVSSGEYDIEVRQGNTTPGNVSFSGNDANYINCGDSGNLSAVDELTFECWVNTSSGATGTYTVLASKYYHLTQREWVAFLTYGTAASRIGLFMYDQSAGAYVGGYSVNATNIIDGTNHHIVMTWDGDTSNPNTGIKLYIDGALTTYTDASNGVFIAVEDTDQPVLIGRQDNLAGRHMKGNIDEVRIYRKAITATEAAQHFAGTFTDESDLVLLLHFDETSSTTYYDSSGLLHHDGTKQGTVTRVATNLSGLTNQAMSLWIDGTMEDMARAITANNTSADYRMMAGNMNPYADNITIDIGGVERLFFAPNSMIIGTNLPDRSGNSNNGTFTFGNNPSGVTVALGSLVSTYQPSIAPTAEEPAADILHDVETSDWFRPPEVPGVGASTLTTHPLRPFVLLVSDNTDLSETQTWRWYGLIFVIFVTVVAATVTKGHYGIAGITAGVCIGLLTAWTIWPVWTLAIAIMAAITGVILERSPSV